MLFASGGEWLKGQNSKYEIAELAFLAVLGAHDYLHVSVPRSNYLHCPNHEADDCHTYEDRSI